MVAFLPRRKHEGIFLWYWEPGRAPGGESHDTVGPLMTGSLEFLTLTCSRWASRNASITVQGTPVQIPRWFLPMNLCSGKPWWPVFTCLSSFGSSGLPCVLPFLTDPRRVVAFSVSSACHLLGFSDDFQTPYMRNPKPEVNNCFLKRHIALLNHAENEKWSYKTMVTVRLAFIIAMYFFWTLYFFTRLQVIVSCPLMSPRGLPWTFWARLVVTNFLQLLLIWECLNCSLTFEGQSCWI